MICDRRWWDDWTFDPAALDRAEQRVTALRASTRQPDGSADGPDRVITALADDLDVPTALAIAEAEGGRSAEIVVEVLGLHPFEPTARTSMLPNP